MACKDLPGRSGIPVVTLHFILAVIFTVMSMPVYAEETVSANPLSGEALFRERCLACHGLGVFIPTVAGLANLPRDRLYQTMRTGMMRDPAAGLNEDQPGAIADYLAGLKSNQPFTARQPSQASLCKPALPPAKGNSHEWTGWAPDNTNTRYLSNNKPGSNQIRDLQLKWAFVFPDTATT